MHVSREATSFNLEYVCLSLNDINFDNNFMEQDKLERKLAKTFKLN